jgi:hypothetical protein
MNLTVSVDDEAVEKAREVAASQGTSLQALVRQYIASLGGERDGASLVARLEEHWKTADKELKARPLGNFKFDREAIYEERIGRWTRGK